MKKLISVILAVASIVCTTSSLAATSGGNLTFVARNDLDTLQANESMTSDMPTFRGGDRIQFDVGELINGNFLTVISYKLKDNVELDNATIQYVNQYTIDAESRTVEYIVRDDTEEGIYKLSLSGNDGTDVINFYYKVGNPNVAMVTPNDGTYWNMAKYTSGGQTLYSVGFVAKAVIGSSEVSFEELGVENFGIEVALGDKKHTENLTQVQFDNISEVLAQHEVEGGYAFVYGVTVYGIDSLENANKIVASPVRHDKN